MNVYTLIDGKLAKFISSAPHFAIAQVEVGLALAGLRSQGHLCNSPVLVVIDGGKA